MRTGAIFSRWLLTENVPGEFPYAAGVFPLKRDGEDPTRMFAGEGGPERTNKGFIMYLLVSPPIVSPPPSTQLPFMVKTRISGLIFMVKLEIPE